MKYRTEEEIQRYTKLVRRRTEKARLREARKQKDLLREARLRSLRKERYENFSSPLFNLEVPENLSFQHSFEEVVNLAEDLQYIVFRKHMRAGVDFTKVKSLGPAAALYLAAEIYQCRFSQPRQARVTGRHPVNRKAAKLLSDMGFNKLLGISDPVAAKSEKNSNRDPQYIQFKTSNDVAGGLAVELRNAIEACGIVFPEEFRRKMYDGLVEAMTNVIHHAYPRDFSNVHGRQRGRWWMAGSIEPVKNEFMMIFYDMGVGIPVTLPKKHPSEIVAGILASLGLRPNDANMIKAATVIGRTQTDQPNRGRGLDDIMAVVRVCQKSELRILSNRGEYIYQSDGTEITKNHRKNINGTLIQWRLSRPSR